MLFIISHTSRAIDNEIYNILLAAKFPLYKLYIYNIYVTHVCYYKAEFLQINKIFFIT